MRGRWIRVRHYTVNFPAQLLPKCFQYFFTNKVPLPPYPLGAPVRKKNLDPWRWEHQPTIVHQFEAASKKLSRLSFFTYLFENRQSSVFSFSPLPLVLVGYVPRKEGELEGAGGRKQGAAIRASTKKLSFLPLLGKITGRRDSTNTFQLSYGFYGFFCQVYILVYWREVQVVIVR